MTAKVRKFVPATVAALSAAAVFTAASATIAAASRTGDDLILDATATVKSTTFSAELAAGDAFISQSSVVDNLTSDKGDGSQDCAVVASDSTGKLVQCAMILRLPKGDIHIRGSYPGAATEPGVGTVLGGSGAYEKVTGAAKITMPDQQTINVKVSKGSPPQQPSTDPAPQQPAVQDPAVGPVAPEPVAEPDVIAPDAAIAGPTGR